jgi:site-specific recombinase XerD
MKLTKIKPYLKKSKVYANGTCPIYISLIRNRRQSLISTGHSIPAESWNEKEGRVWESKPRITPMEKATLTAGELEELKRLYSAAIVLSNAKTINQEIANKIAELILLQNKLRANEESLDVKNIKIRYDVDPDQDRTKNFLAYWQGLVDKTLHAGNIGTHKRYKTILERLKTYVKGQILTFQEITVQFLSDYEAHLKREGLKVNTIHNNFKTIRAVYYTAIKESIIPQDKNPFFTFKAKTEKVRKEKLNVEEVKKLQELKLEPGSMLWHVRNYFIFSFNVAGIRVGDLIQLRWQNITSARRLEYTMDKTGNFKSVKLNDKVEQILSYYYREGVKPTDYIFPLLSNDGDYSDRKYLFNQISSKTAVINKYLKKLAEVAVITKKLTTHIARHSFADIARKKNTNIYDIKNMLGQSSTKITEIYLASLDYESQDEAMKDVLDI